MPPTAPYTRESATDLSIAALLTAQKIRLQGTCIKLNWPESSAGIRSHLFPRQSPELSPPAESLVASHITNSGVAHG